MADKPSQPKSLDQVANNITNGIIEKPSVIAARPKNGAAIAIVDPKPTTIIPGANIAATTIVAPATDAAEANPKKSGIRIKYSGINNGAKRLSIVEQNNSAKPNLPKEPIAQIPSNILEAKENKHVPAVTPKPTKDTRDHENSFEELVKFADIDDIELPDGTKIGFPTELQDFGSPGYDGNNSMDSSMDSSMSMNESSVASSLDVALKAKKSLNRGKPRHILRHQKHKNYTRSGDDGSSSSNGVFKCRHCGKRYRWKSTLRRHENDECGNKLPAHECPYCPYKAKQRGNLGVHVRKHHADKPELESKRKRRTLWMANWTDSHSITQITFSILIMIYFS